MYFRAAMLLLAAVLGSAAHAQCAARFDTIPAYAHGFFLALADFDGDGHLDTLTAAPDEAAARVNFGRPDGTFDRGPATPLRAAVDRQPHLFDAVSGDWNEDGVLDAAIAAQSLGAVELLLGRGDGTFAPHTVAELIYPRAVTAADFDGDDHLDLVVADPDQPQVAVFWGKGDGTFAAPLGLPIDVGSDVAAGDLNGDGRADLVIGRSSLGLDVLLAGSGRTFAAPHRLEILRDHWGLVVRDFDGDGKLDIALADPSAFAVSTFRGNGDGTFQPRIDAPAGIATEGIAFGELTGDGRLDMVAGNGPEGRIVVLAGLEDGTFDLPVKYHAGGNLWGVHVADLNGDGLDDVIVSDVAAYTVLLQNDANGFPQLDSVRAGNVVYDTVVADFNGDTIPDLAAADLESSVAGILLGRGDGTFALWTNADLGVGPISLGAADFNADGKPDLVAGCRFEVSVALGRGDGRFDPPSSYLPVEAMRFYVVAPGDVDRDGDVDIAAVDRAASAIRFLVNDGTGHFTLSAASVSSTPVPARPLLVDVDHDGAADLVHAWDRNDSPQGGAGFLDVRLGRGNGTFRDPLTIPAGLDPWDVRAADLDGDGHVDLLVTSWNSDGGVRLYRGDGAGAFDFAASLSAYGQALDVAVEDFNHDGVSDVAVNDGRLVYVYQGMGGFAFRAPEAHVAAESPFTLGAADFNRDGWIDIATGGFFGNVTVQLNEPVCRRRTVRR